MNIMTLLRLLVHKTKIKRTPLVFGKLFKELKG